MSLQNFLLNVSAKCLIKISHQNVSSKCLTGLYLYYDESRDIRWNIAWARGKSRGRSPRDFPVGSGYISPYIPTWVIIQTFSISKSILPVLSFLVGQHWKSWFSVLVWQLGYIFPYCPADEAIWVRIDPVKNFVVAALGNIHGQESNTRRLKFQYNPFK